MSSKGMKNACESRTSPGEEAKVRIGKGKVEVITGSGHHGQAYLSSFSKLVIEELGVSENVI